MINQNNDFEVIVIGGGPAGMMAAGRAAELGAKTLLIEKNKLLGRKLTLTGKGRCNLTNAEFNEKKFLENFGKSGRFLFPAILHFGPREVIDFFAQHKLRTKIERGQRVFPTSNQAIDVLAVLNDHLQQTKVQIMSDVKVMGFEVKNKQITGLKLWHRFVRAKYYILCTGGKSYPATGSTGDGYQWAEALGHHLVAPRPALVPIRIKENWVKDLQGLSLKNVQINLYQNNKKIDQRFGEMLFTHFGLSGPIILDLSKRVGEVLNHGPLILKIDLKPALDFEQLDQRITRDFQKYQNKSFKNALNDLLPKKMISCLIKLSKIDPDKKVNAILKTERKNLVQIFKNLTMTIEGLMGFDQAIITSGGIDLKEIDPRTMRSKIVDNLFFAGEIINLDGPTGGFNLQVAWSTGYLAGESAAIFVKNLST